MDGEHLCRLKQIHDRHHEYPSAAIWRCWFRRTRALPQSIKYHTCLVVSVIVFWGTQIVARVASLFFAGLPPPSPDVNVPLECGIFGVFVSLSMAQLWLAPQIFLNYCLVTSIESLVKREALDAICLEKESIVLFSYHVFKVNYRAGYAAENPRSLSSAYLSMNLMNRSHASGEVMV